MAAVKSGQVLIVDDDDPLRRALVRALGVWGHVVMQASSVREAVVILESVKPDVVLADVHMPGVSGLELLKILSRSARDVPIIFLTGGPSVEDGVKAVEMGAYRYLTKPISLRDLEAVIQSALTDRARRSEPRID